MYGVTNKPNNYFSDYNAAKTTKFAGSKTADDKSTKKADTFESSVKNYTEIDESTWAGKEEAHPYKKLSWKPMFEDETILNDDPSIPDADGKF